MPPLAETLAREAALVRAFIACLGDEQEALKQGDVQALPAITARKSALAAQLNATEGERNVLLGQQGYAGDRDGMQAWLAANRNDRATAREWAGLLRAAAEARELNEINGRLIAMRLQATNQALEALSQEARSSTLYGPDGQSTQRTGSRIIDAA